MACTVEAGEDGCTVTVEYGTELMLRETYQSIEEAVERSHTVLSTMTALGWEEADNPVR